MAIVFSSGTQSGPTKILQVKKFNVTRQSVTVPGYDNNVSSYRQIGSLNFSITPVAANSKFLIDFNVFPYDTGSHFYLTMKRNSIWLHTNYNGSMDGLFANHSNSGSEYWNCGFRWVDEPAQNNTNSISYTPWIAHWGSRTVWVNDYGNNGNARVDATHCVITEIAA